MDPVGGGVEEREQLLKGRCLPHLFRGGSLVVYAFQLRDICWGLCGMKEAVITREGEWVHEFHRFDFRYA